MLNHVTCQEAINSQQQQRQQQPTPTTPTTTNTKETLMSQKTERIQTVPILVSDRETEKAIKQCSYPEEGKHHDSLQIK